MTEQDRRWPGLGEVSPEKHAELLAAAKGACGRYGPHLWKTPIVGDDLLVCSYCGAEVDLLTAGGYDPIDEHFDYWDIDEALAFLGAYNAAAADARRRRSAGPKAT